MGDGFGRLLPARTSYVNFVFPWCGFPWCRVLRSAWRTGAGKVCLGPRFVGLEFPVSVRRQLFFCGLRSSETHPLNLSISISGGRETNRDSLSNGERSGKKPRSEISPSALSRRGELWSGEADCPDPLLASPKLTWNGTPKRVRAP